jgi:phenylalanyl-tRNA synthetase beta chain
MRIPLSWLGEMVELRGSPNEICDVLTGAGIETEIGEDDRPSWDGVVTAKLLSVERHPDADRLTVTKPFDGTTERTVVCGANNHKVGDIVALATPGTTLPGNFKIKKSKMRGVPSEGMLCSTAELHIGGDADGIIILPADTPIGVPLSDVLDEGDVILDVSPTANRGDCLSVLGLARELSAVTGWPLRGRQTDDDEDAGLATLIAAPALGGDPRGTAGYGDLSVSVAIEAPDGCPRYTGAVMDGVTVKPSPEWMQKRLEAAGVRPINNVVDCTNYVMLELGNPLHAFDRRFVRGDIITVRRATEGEAATTLDGANHTLVASDLIIADGEGVVALAGVMGGENSEVRDDTEVLFLESAHFEPGTVRATAHRCKLGTESSYRFARGVDPELPRSALHRLISLIEETAGAAIVGQPLDLYPRPAQRPIVSLRLSRVKGLLGMDLTADRVFELLHRDGLGAENPAGFAADPPESVRIRPPSYRFDLEREVDILEEIARLEGFDKLPEVVPSRTLRSVPRRAPGLDVGALRDAMVSAGLSEAVHFSFIDPDWIRDLGLSDDHPWLARAVEVANPLSEVGGILRPSLIPSLLRAAARNRAMGAADVRLFEVRPVFQTREGGYADILAGDGRRPLNKPPVIERRTLSGVVIGRRNAPGWAGDDDALDYADLKGIVDAAGKAVGWRGWSWQAEGAPSFLDPRESASLEGAGGRGSAGWMGRIAAPILRAFEVDAVAWAFELDLSRLAPKKTKPVKFQAFSRFPGSSRDLAVVVEDAVSAESVIQIAEKTARKGMKDALRGVELFDVYRGTGVPDGARSLALRFRFRAPDRTLEDKAVDATMAQVGKQLSGRDGITLRS